MNNIELYRWAFPICGLGCIIFVFFAYFGTEERTIVHKEYVAQVKFLEGTKQLLTNKYFWIITLYTVFIGVRGNINMYLWICNYAISGQKRLVCTKCVQHTAEQRSRSGNAYRSVFD